MKTTGERRTLKREGQMPGKRSLKREKSIHETTHRGRDDFRRDKLGYVLESGI